MEIKTLYELPKDMLVKLVSTIQNDLVDIYEPKMKELEIYKKRSVHSVLKCQVCPNMHVINRSDKDEYYCEDDANITPIFCSSCVHRTGVVYCDTHYDKTEVNKYSYGPSYIPKYACKKCAPMYEKNGWSIVDEYSKL